MTAYRFKRRARPQTASSCRSCHLDIDPYGLALDDLDAVGHSRSEDQDGSPIDASVTLPALVGGAKVHSSLELSSALPSGALALCFSQRFLDHAVALLCFFDPPRCGALHLSAHAHCSDARAVATRLALPRALAPGSGV
jgi:hypothetical protein